MTMLVGLDLNGLWDWAAVFDEDVGDERSLDLGINPAGVRLASAKDTLVVGPQTALSPHGRGQGWAALGHHRLRMSHAELLDKIVHSGAREDDLEASQMLEAIMRSIVDRGQATIIPVPDDSSFDEAAREKMLRAFRRGRAPNPSLIWRPVAATLDWSASLHAHQGSAEGLRVAVLSILRDRVHFGELSLIVENGRGGSLLVPERRRAGSLVWDDFGGASLATWVAQQIARTTGLKVDELLLGARCPWTMAVGQAAGMELFRTANRDWCDLAPPEAPERLNPPSDPPSDVIERLSAADVVLVEGGGSQSPAILRGALYALGLEIADPRIHLLAPRSVARGALAAGRRLRRGEPAYYDFLPQLQINALVEGKARFVSLIPSDTRLRGGQVYRDKAVGDFAIGKGAHQLEFYLVKEDFDRARRSIEALPETADRQYRISVSVEQSPGQGFARVRIGSDVFTPLAARPIELDWTRMEIVEEGPEQILASLLGKKGGAYPDAQVYSGHAVLWHPESRHGDVINALATYIDIPLVGDGQVTQDGASALKHLKDIASKSVVPAYEAERIGLVVEETAPARFLNTDGSLPEPKPKLFIPSEAENLLVLALEKAATDYSLLVRMKVANDHLRALIGFTTWCYRRCPIPIVQGLLDWYEDGGAGQGGDLIVRLEGLGRVIYLAQDARRFYRVIEHRVLAGQQLRSSELAALTRLLGGVDQAADWLNQDQANRFVQATQGLIEEQNCAQSDQAYKRKFKFALLMLASLLRRRRSQPEFLDPDNRAARSLERSLHDAQDRMAKLAEGSRNRAKRATGRNRQALLAAASRLNKANGIVTELIAFIHQEGSDPNIIQKIEAMED